MTVPGSKTAARSSKRIPLYEREPEAQRGDRVRRTGGSAPLELKERLMDMFVTDFFMEGRGFGDAVGGRMEVTDISLSLGGGTGTENDGKGKSRQESSVVCEIDVEEDMVNSLGNLHGGCAVFIVSLCATLNVTALHLANGGSGIPGVAQVIDTVFHSSAKIGDHLRIVSWTLAMGARTSSSRCEIWNDSTHKLVASGIQVKMAHPPPTSMPSPKL